MMTAPFAHAPDPSAAGATTPATLHRPVMLDEVLQGLMPRADGIYVDGTFGRGGHSRALLAQLGARARLIALDQDPEAVAYAQALVQQDARFSIIPCNFEALGEVIAEQGLTGRINGVMLDLGVSSPQLDQAARGFSFSRDGPLDMRMNPQAGQSAAEWLAEAAEAEIADVLWTYGDERNSRRIARRIVETRAQEPITRTAQLAALIAAVPGPRSHKIHPATRSFQAIRIFINRELDVLPLALDAAIAVLAPQGRLAVISFHSLEDRLVKRYLRDDARSDAPRIRLCGKQFPSREESSANPRARSAVLRIAERLPGVTP